MSEARTGQAAPNTVTVIGIVDSTGVVKPLGGTAGVSLVVDNDTVSKGNKRLTLAGSSALLSSVSGGIPSGAGGVMAFWSESVTVWSNLPDCEMNFFSSFSCSPRRRRRPWFR